MTESCQGCANVHREVTGVIECSFAPDGFVDRWRLVCRRDPPQVGLFGSRYPKVRDTDWCSGFRTSNLQSPKARENDPLQTCFKDTK